MKMIYRDNVGYIVSQSEAEKLLARGFTARNNGMPLMVSHTVPVIDEEEFEQVDEQVDEEVEEVKEVKKKKQGRKPRRRV